MCPLCTPTDETQSIAGSLYYKSPEMLLSYSMSELSTDVWSLGCIFVSWLFRETIYFSGSSVLDQLHSIAMVRSVVVLLSVTKVENILYIYTFDISILNLYDFYFLML